MHKYQPRLHVIRTADLAQIPWAPQQAFVFAETEFVAVTAYQVSFPNHILCPCILADSLSIRADRTNCLIWATIAHAMGSPPQH